MNNSKQFFKKKEYNLLQLNVLILEDEDVFLQESTELGENEEQFGWFY